MIPGRYQLAAQQGNADAQRSLGWMYEVGVGFPQDEGIALKWYRLAAEQGNDRAQDKVAELENKNCPTETPTHSHCRENTHSIFG